MCVCGLGGGRAVCVCVFTNSTHAHTLKKNGVLGKPFFSVVTTTFLVKNELMVEIYSKSLVRAIGKVSNIEFS